MGQGCVPLTALVAIVLIPHLILAQISQTVYKAVINDATSASTPLFTIDVVGSPSDYMFFVAGEMAANFTVPDGNGVVSINQPISIGRYEFTLSALTADNLYTAIALVDVLSSSNPCDNQLLYGRCSHICVADNSNPHTYSCQCHSGYSLQRNGYICRANDPEPSLLFSYANGLSKLDTFTRVVHPIINDVAVEAFDYHYGYQVIYYSIGNTVYSVSITGQNPTIVYEGSNDISSIAVNWLNNDVYFTSTSGTIGRITVGPTATTTMILSSLSSPLHLVLDAEDGVMYWTEGIDSDATIRRAALNGTGINDIARNVNGLQDLSVDTIEHRVYWNAVSGNVYQILSAAENGNDITVIHNSAPFQSGSLSVFEDYVYSAKVSTQFIYRVDKYTRRFTVNVTLSAGEDVNTIKVYHRLKQPNSVEGNEFSVV
ncbi:very low-density lipoprotein receptor-like [Dysidea avara]|uniref:very low-density lipoprotein receptor-like n=1 Tax=Dysidea avara TaxID=196820 RepID=UPI00332F5AA5